MAEIQRVEFDVSSVAPVGASVEVGDLFLPSGGRADDDSRPPTTLVVCVPGGGMTRRYFDLPEHLPGRWSMARHLVDDHGLAVLTLDHLGVGDSPPPDDPYTLTPRVVAAVNAHVVAEAVAGLRAGRLVADLGPLALDRVDRPGPLDGRDAHRPSAGPTPQLRRGGPARLRRGGAARPPRRGRGHLRRTPRRAGAGPPGAGGGPLRHRAGAAVGRRHHCLDVPEPRGHHTGRHRAARSRQWDDAGPRRAHLDDPRRLRRGPRRRRRARVPRGGRARHRRRARHPSGAALVGPVDHRVRAAGSGPQPRDRRPPRAAVRRGRSVGRAPRSPRSIDEPAGGGGGA